MIEGAYRAERAAALSGVPVSTIRYWANHDILVPSLSPVRIKLWSFADLMGLRVIAWLRHDKKYPSGVRVSAASMLAVRQSLKQLAELDLSLWTERSGPTVSVDRSGRIYITTEANSEVAHRQRSIHEVNETFTLSGEFSLLKGISGPDLHKPRPSLRIVPGKLGGSPHIVDTRLESQVLGSLASQGVPRDRIYRLYPDIEGCKIDDAIDLEQQLAASQAA